jgi:hypothetical protein
MMSREQGRWLYNFLRLWIFGSVTIWLTYETDRCIDPECCLDGGCGEEGSEE